MMQPRKGCFEVRDSDGKTFVSLLVRITRTPFAWTGLRQDVPARPAGAMRWCFRSLTELTPSVVGLQDMPRPFAKLKALDLDELAQAIAAGGAAQA